jgi:exopolysaccharide production protein ExoZ
MQLGDNSVTVGADKVALGTENIQILRFVAAGLVLITHITFYIHERLDPNFSVWHNGEVGVPIFFVISGFIIYLTGKSMPLNAAGASLFLRKRVARVMPLYWMMTLIKIVIALVAPAVIYHNRPDFFSSIGSLLLVPMLDSSGSLFLVHGVGWTLLHEMFFYYTFSLALLIGFPPLVFCGIVISGLVILGTVVEAKSAIAMVVFSKINLMFVFGMVLAFYFERGVRINRVIAIFLLLVAVTSLIDPTVNVFLRSLSGNFGLEPILIVAALLSMQLPKFGSLKSRALALGDCSYSMYMTHPIVAPGICIVLSKLGIQSPYLVLLLTFVLCTVVSVVVFRYLEAPANQKLKQRLITQAT